MAWELALFLAAAINGLILSLIFLVSGSKDDPEELTLPKPRVVITGVEKQALKKNEVC